MIDNRVYAYNRPHLYHLARLDEQYPRYAAVLTDTNTARIFVFGLGQVIDSQEVNGKKVHRFEVGGWSQARYQRRVGNAHKEHDKEVLDIHASEQDVLSATLVQIQEQEAKTAGEKVHRLMHQYRARGLALVGLQERLEALANGQVELSSIFNAAHHLRKGPFFSKKWGPLHSEHARRFGTRARSKAASLRDAIIRC